MVAAYGSPCSAGRPAATGDLQKEAGHQRVCKTFPMQMLDVVLHLVLSICARLAPTFLKATIDYL